jgi:hypothetical protein
MSKEGKTLLAKLEENGMIEYGTVIPRSTVRSYLGLTYPNTDGLEFAEIKRIIEQQSFIEMATTSYVRDVLLDVGMYLRSEGDNYRILLPSENMDQVRKYEESADRKFFRARKLLRNTPPDDSRDFRDARRNHRMMMKQSEARHRPS